MILLRILLWIALLYIISFSVIIKIKVIIGKNGILFKSTPMRTDIKMNNKLHVKHNYCLFWWHIWVSKDISVVKWEKNEYLTVVVWSVRRFIAHLVNFSSKSLKKCSFRRKISIKMCKMSFSCNFTYADLFSLHTYTDFVSSQILTHQLIIKQPLLWCDLPKKGKKGRNR